MASTVAYLGICSLGLWLLFALALPQGCLVAYLLATAPPEIMALAKNAVVNPATNLVLGLLLLGFGRRIVNSRFRAVTRLAAGADVTGAQWVCTGTLLFGAHAVTSRGASAVASLIWEDAALGWLLAKWAVYVGIGVGLLAGSGHLAAMWARRQVPRETS